MSVTNHWFVSLDMWKAKVLEFGYTFIECECKEVCKSPTKWECTAYKAMQEKEDMGAYNSLTGHGYLKKEDV